MLFFVSWMVLESIMLVKLDGEGQTQMISLTCGVEGNRK